MENNKQSSVIDQAISQIEEKIINSRTDNTTTRRSGDYRIGLNEAKNILEGLRAIHKEEIVNAYVSGVISEMNNLLDAINYKIDGDQYYNQTFGGNK